MPELATELSTKPIAQAMEQDLTDRVQALRDHDPMVVPSLAIVTDNIADHEPTRRYVELKSRIAAKLGVYSRAVSLPHDHGDNIIAEVNKLNKDDAVDGIIVQLPLFINTNANTDRVLSTINPYKDVDGLGLNALYPSATSSAVMEIMKWYGVDFREQEIAVFGLGRLVGSPLLELLEDAEAQHVTACDKATPEEDRIEVLNRAPIIVTAMGIGDIGQITPDLFEDITIPRVVIDAGTAEQSGEVVGDISDELREAATEYGWQITPKKGWGVGSLTVRTLLSHVVDAAELRANAS